MSSVKFKLDKQGVCKNVLQASWMKDHVESEAKNKADADTHLRTFIGFDRAKSIIYPNTKEHEE